MASKAPDEGMRSFSRIGVGEPFRFKKGETVYQKTGSDSSVEADNPKSGIRRCDRRQYVYPLPPMEDVRTVRALTERAGLEYKLAISDEAADARIAEFLSANESHRAELTWAMFRYLQINKADL